MKPVLATILVQAGAAIAFGVNADGGSVPAAGRSAVSDLVEGEIRWVDPTAGRLTVMHGRHKSLGMPPMTMVIRVKDSGRLTQFRTGDRIRFAAERVNGLLTATVLQPAK